MKIIPITPKFLFVSAQAVNFMLRPAPESRAHPLKKIHIMSDLTKYEHRSVIKFLSAEGVSAKEIHERTENVYGGDALH